MLTPMQVSNVFEAILGRLPGSDIEICELQERFDSVQTLRTYLLQWPEFATRYRELQRRLKLSDSSRKIQESVIVRSLVQNDENDIHNIDYLQKDNTPTSLFSTALRNADSHVILISGYLPETQLSDIIDVSDLQSHTTVITTDVPFFSESHKLSRSIDCSRLWNSNAARLGHCVTHIRIDLHPAMIIEILGNLGIYADTIIVLNDSSFPMSAAKNVLFSFLGPGILCLKNLAEVERIAISEYSRLEPAIFEDFTVFSTHRWLGSVEIAPAQIIFDTTSTSNKDLRSKLALGVITKGEFDNLRNMILSAVPYVGAIVCLDTGSGEDIFSLERSLLDNLPVETVLTKSEFSRFDTARNTVIEICPSNYEWMLMLDSDEILSAGQTDVISRLINNDLNIDAWMIPRVNWVDLSHKSHTVIYPDRQGRLFRLNGTIRYAGAVHEVLSGYQKLGLAPVSRQIEGDIVLDSFHIHHMQLIYRGTSNSEKHQAYQKLGSRI